ncbi:MAG: phosphoribosylanthranilate isomerase [Gammaproteobacteria bacterium]|nr:phosphoribosylanthranilate isomerase [Gammaproteobacteria bacterium]
MRTRVKICGITRIQDAMAAVEAGADAVGFVFYRPSPRCVEIDAAAAIMAALPPFVTPVGLFVDAAEDWVRQVLSCAPLALLQFHGSEPPAYCGAFGRPYIKVVRMAPGTDVGAQARLYGAAAGLLLDTYDAARPGGTGASFDWARVPADLGRPLVLAGGLTPDNVGLAVAQVRPYAVDVSGGVESAPGIKDRERMTLFCRRAREER